MNNTDESNIIVDYANGLVYFFTTRRGVFNQVAKRLLGDVSFESDEQLHSLLSDLGLKATINTKGKAYTLNNIPISRVRSLVSAFKTTNKRKSNKQPKTDEEAWAKFCQ